MSERASTKGRDDELASASYPHELPDAPAFEQRHFRIWLNSWSDWYPSTAEAYREHIAGPVKQYDVRRAAND